MKRGDVNWSIVQETVEELIGGQKKALLKLGRRIVPTLTPEDMLQPNDYVELECHPEFRYEEGILAGMQMVQMAFLATQRESIPERESRISKCADN